VDALCINQEDKSEKAGQIGLMTQVYGRAEQVYIWLGELSDSAAAVIRHLQFKPVRIGNIWY
jgi:hypothetical protein